jgi:hypothetical protein
MHVDVKIHTVSTNAAFIDVVGKHLSLSLHAI